MIKLSKNKIFFIAEIGLNHNGSYDLAESLIEKSINSGADIIKFQIRNLEDLYSKKNINTFGLGAQYIYDVITKFDLKFYQYKKLFSLVKRNGAIPLCTPFDLTSLNFLIEEKFEFFKIASADLMNYELIEKAGKNSKKLILSTGMHNEKEIIQTSKFLKKNSFDSIFLHCNSTYPTPYEDINLNYIKRLKKVTMSKFVGYSGHERGFHIPLAAIALGAKVIEKHITIDRNMEGPDHKVSLLPNEYKKMVELSNNILNSLGKESIKKNISQGEIINKESLSKSLYANTKIKAGNIIKKSDLTLKSPAQGLSNAFIKKLIGTKALRNKELGDPFDYLDLKEQKINKKFYFKRKYGLPVRFHDYKKIYQNSNLDFLEFHLSYKDMDLDVDKFFDKKLNCKLIVHAPDLYQNDHILNLADENSDQSIYELQRVINLTRKLNKYFDDEKPNIVASIGGYTRDKRATGSQINKMINTLIKNLKKLDFKNTRLLAQTLPPFPWYLGGQMHCNLFVKPDDIFKICSKSELKLCLDLSHTKLSANKFNFNYDDFLKTNGKFIKHLHLADAKDHNSEGLQIGDGDINWARVLKLLDIYSPEASFIPEIWQGHLNGGNGFWTALKKLSKFSL